MYKPELTEVSGVSGDGVGGSGVQWKPDITKC